MAPLHPFLKNGYYTVGSTIYSSKLKALMAATATNQWPQWTFNNDVFEKTPWTIEPSEDIAILYQQRAVALREQYDYVVLLYSAGVDSQTVFDSFVASGKPVDEIIVFWAVEAAEKYAGAINDFRPENCLAEWNYLIKPQLNYIRKTWPKIKITVIDSTGNIAKNNFLEEDFFAYENYYGIATLNRWPQAVQNMDKISEKHSNTVIICGVDKPQLKFQNNQLFIFFLDKSIVFKSTEKTNIEYFYWSPDATEILRKQGHLILNYFRNNPHLITALNTRDDNLLKIINYCIYPNYNPLRFQVNKQTYEIFNEQFNWVWSIDTYKDKYKIDRWKGQITDFNKVIDNKYKQHKNNLYNGYIGSVTPDYLIGDL